MSTVWLGYKQKNYHPQTVDAYKTRCGEVFITFNHILIFHCLLCNSEYKCFDSFMDHLSEKNYPNVCGEFTRLESESVKARSYSFENEDEYPNKYNTITVNEDIGISGVNDRVICDPSDDEHDCYDRYELGSIDNNGTEYEELSQAQSFNAENENFEMVQIEEDIFGKCMKRSKLTEDVLDEPLYDYKELKSKKYEETFPKMKRKRTKLDITGFSCDKCDKYFNTKPHLKRHLLIHSEERKYKCTICGFAFKEKNNLNAHTRRHNGQKKISCDVCSKKFFTRTEGELHMRIHTGEKPYICSHCGKAFAAMSGMMRCTKQHTEEPPIKCSHCTKRFWFKAELQKHMIVHTKDKPFTCPICSARFPRLRSCLRHTKLHERP